MPAPKLTSEIIVAAILGFEAQKTRIDARIAELRAMLGGGPTEPAAQEAPRGKGKKRSAAARKRMAEAQRRRWAERCTSPPALQPGVVAMERVSPRC